MTSVQLPNSSTVSFKYDPFGRRIQKASSVFVYEGANLIQEATTGGSLIARYMFGSGIDEPLAAYRGASSEFYQADGLGSVTSLSTTASVLSDSFSYDSFGNLLSSTGSFSQPFGYTGREWDAETGLYYYRARYYDSTNGRFLSEDPIRLSGGNNFYLYGSNNPTDLIDPLGLCPPQTSRPWRPKDCAGVTSADLDYATKTPRKGGIKQNAEEHITKYHINQYPGKSRYWARGNVPRTFSSVMKLNAQTFELGNATVDPITGNIIIEYFPPPDVFVLPDGAWEMWLWVGKTQAGIPTPYNRLVLYKDCRIPASSYPISYHEVHPPNPNNP